MAMVTLSKEAKEGGSYIIEVRVKDENNNFVAPTSLKWWLSDNKGNPINNREDVEVQELSKNTVIVLTENDLVPGYLIFTVKGTYDSVYGLGMKFSDAVKFYCRDLIEEE